MARELVVLPDELHLIVGSGLVSWVVDKTHLVEIVPLHHVVKQARDEVHDILRYTCVRQAACQQVGSPVR